MPLNSCCAAWKQFIDFRLCPCSNRQLEVMGGKCKFEKRHTEVEEYATGSLQIRFGWRALSYIQIAEMTWIETAVGTRVSGVEQSP